MFEPTAVTICEVGPRDGLQSEARWVPTAAKIELINGLIAAGVPVIEATSFVHPGRVPQMRDAAQVLAGSARRPGTRIAALAPNLKGAERALAAGVDEIRVVVITSETYNRLNVRMSVAESLAQVDRIVAAVRAAELPVYLNGGVSAAFGCPYEGAVSEAQVFRLVEHYANLGFAAVTLADSTGVADPAQVFRLSSAVRRRWPHLVFTLHLHNTRGMGLANLIAGLQAGITSFDASLGGLGGCPFAPDAYGNICTEDTVHMLERMGCTTGIDLPQLLRLSAGLEALVGRRPPGLVLSAGPSDRRFPVPDAAAEAEN